MVKDQVETFALSRFRRIDATGQTFARPAEFNPESYARQAFGIMGGEESIKVSGAYSPKVGPMVADHTCTVPSSSLAINFMPSGLK
jgi:hypothetical protein